MRIEEGSSSLYCDEAGLACSERVVHANGMDVVSMVDPVLLNDERVVANMLAEEEEAGARIVDYMASLQTELKPHMRKIVTDWMVEVCEDHQCSPEVFSLAVNYLDRFLSRVTIKKSQFQLVATVCILLASKFVEAVPISSEKLRLYTDNSVRLQELRDWELKVLLTLGWELSAVTAHSFLDHLLHSTPLASLDPGLSLAAVRRHAESLVAVAATEYRFLSVRPSVVAAASLAAACSGLSRSPAAGVALAADRLLSARINQRSVVGVVCQIEAYIGALSGCPEQEQEQVGSQPAGYHHHQQQQQYIAVEEPKMDGSRTPTDLPEMSTLLEVF